MSNNKIHSGSHIKKIFTKGSWYFLASTATKMMAILILPVATRYLTEQEVGILDSLESIRQLLPIFISLCLDEAYHRFYFHYKQDKANLKRYISTYFWIILAWGVITFVISLIIGRIFLTDLFNIPFSPYIPLTMIGPLLLQLSVLGGAYLRQELKAELLSIIEVLLYVFFYIVFIILLVIPKLGALSKIYAFFTFDILSFLIFGFMLFKKKLIGFAFDKKVLKEGLVYAIPLIPNQASFWITGLSDRIILGIYKTFANTGIYSIGYKLGQTLRMFSESIFKVYRPIMLSMYAENKKETIKRLEKFIPFYFFLLLWMGFCIAMFAKEAIIILTAPKFHEAYIVTPVIVAAYFFGGMYKLFFHIVSLHKKTWIISTGALIQAASNLIFNLIFIPVFGKMAAACTTLFSYIVFFIWLFAWSQKLERIHIDYIKIIKILVIPAITFGIYFTTIYFVDLHFVVNMIYKIILTGLALLVSYYLKLVDFRINSGETK